MRLKFVHSPANRGVGESLRPATFPSLALVTLLGRPGLSQDDRGATSAEYAILVSMIALVIIGAVATFGTNVVPLFHVPASAL